MLNLFEAMVCPSIGGEGYLDPGFNLKEDARQGYGHNGL